MFNQQTTLNYDVKATIALLLNRIIALLSKLYMVVVLPWCLVNQQLQTGEVAFRCGIVGRNCPTVRLVLGSSAH